MKTIEDKDRESARFINTLELSDFDYLSDEFSAVADSLGFELTSKKDSMLSISIGQYGIKYDRDISARRMFIAVERVDINARVLESYAYRHNNDKDSYKQYLPMTSDLLSELVEEFKFSGLGNVSLDEVINFIKK